MHDSRPDDLAVVPLEVAQIQRSQENFNITDRSAFPRLGQPLAKFRLAATEPSLLAMLLQILQRIQAELGARHSDDLLEAAHEPRLVRPVTVLTEYFLSPGRDRAWSEQDVL